MIRTFFQNKNPEESKSQPTTQNRISPGLNRLKKDMEELDLPENVKLEIPNKADPGNMIISLKPTKDSLWFHGKYTFTVNVTQEYPYEAPKVNCQEKVFFLII